MIVSDIDIHRVSCNYDFLLDWDNVINLSLYMSNENKNIKKNVSLVKMHAFISGYSTFHNYYFYITILLKQFSPFWT